jgi:hypothetical protein
MLKSKKPKKFPCSDIYLVMLYWKVLSYVNQWNTYTKKSDSNLIWRFSINAFKFIVYSDFIIIINTLRVQDSWNLVFLDNLSWIKIDQDSQYDCNLTSRKLFRIQQLTIKSRNK